MHTGAHERVCCAPCLHESIRSSFIAKLFMQLTTFNPLQGDLIHADRHGAVVVPIELASQTIEACELVTRREAVILSACRKADFKFEDLKKAIEGADEIH